MGVDIVFEDNLPAVKRELSRVAYERMETAVTLVRNRTLETLSGHRSGHTYFVPGTRRSYTASAPGEAPAQATGRLRQNICSEVVNERGTLHGRVGTDIDYGRMLEFRTVNIIARPWLRKTFERAEAEVKAIFMRVWF